MFSTPIDTPGVTSGELIWATTDGADDSATVELWSPTDARPNELRIARFYDVGGWGIDEDQCRTERAQGYHWFYVLELGGSDMVTARLLQQQHFDLADPLVAEHLRAQLHVRQPGRSARGAVDLQERRRLDHLSALRKRGFETNRRVLDVQKTGQDCAMSEAMFREVTGPRSLGNQRASALKFGGPVVFAMLSVLLILRKGRRMVSAATGE